MSAEGSEPFIRIKKNAKYQRSRKYPHYKFFNWFNLIAKFDSYTMLETEAYVNYLSCAVFFLQILANLFAIQYFNFRYTIPIF